MIIIIIYWIAIVFSIILGIYIASALTLIIAGIYMKFQDYEAIEWPEVFFAALFWPRIFIILWRNR